MALVIPEGFYEAAFHHTQTLTTRPAVCTLGVEYNGTDFPTDAPLFGGSWASVMAELCSAVTYTRFTMRNQIGLVVDIGLSLVGGADEVCQTYNTAYLVKKASGTPGRHAQGRMFLPGVQEALVGAAGDLAPLLRTSLQTAMDAFKDELETRNFDACILHQEGAGPGPTPPPTPISNFVVDPRVATQRNRMRG